MLDLSGIPPTHLLYYEDAYVKEFDSNVVKVLKTENHETSVILDGTAFYPGSGGQPPDIGLIEGSTMQAKVVRLQRKGEIIIHHVDEIFGEIREGAHVRGIINWERRYGLMRIHTSAHLMSQAIRQALGEPVEIVSSGMDLEKARLDFTHADSTREFFPQIETIANHVVKENRIVKIRLTLRNEAEECVKKFHESLKTLPP